MISTVRTRIAAVLAATVAAAGLVSSVPAAQAAVADEVYEVHYVDTIDGAKVRVEVWRDTSFDATRQPVILTYSPYNSLSEPEPARDELGSTYVPKGYARAVADVLGTRGSTGCWDYGGPKEQQSGVDVVEYLADLGWSNGKVAMIGGSYNGTTANMVAARGTGARGLAGIVPISAISRWYGYAYGNGVRYFLNSTVPSDEGFDTPLAFDFGFAKTVAADPMGQHFADTLRARAAECGAVEHTEEGYSRNPDYDDFWLERDYRKDAAQFRVPVLLAHGWQDYNVKQEEATELYRALPVDDPATAEAEGVPFKLMYLTQGSHSGGTSGAQWEGLLERFLAHTLKGVDNGIENAGPVITEGRKGGSSTGFRSEADYPLPGTQPTTLWLRPSFDGDELPGVILPPPLPALGEHGALSTKPNKTATDPTSAYLETGASTEELARTGLYHLSLPLAKDTRLVGSAVLDAWVKPSAATMHLTPVLVDVAPDGTYRTIERGFLHLDYRNGLEATEPAPGQWQRARVTLLPQDVTVPAGHRIGLFVQSSNTVWAVPGNPGTVEVANGKIPLLTQGSRLLLPTIGRQARFTTG